MTSLSLFGESGLERPATPPSGTPAQGLFGAKADKTCSPLPSPEQFARV